ncbi:MAG TPA: response regulator [Phototrophicaceae bacterium]|nr:response regulator [Phototrophicaceae bacterium]
MPTCLVVDDSKTIRKIITGIINQLGFTCTEAEDGQVAYNACQAAMPDVIMLDWNMPVMNGLEFLVKLRAMPNGTSPKVLFCTTENDMEFIQKGMEAGADEFIMKPFDQSIITTKFVQLGLMEEKAS